jgi:hypothetical protein
MHHRLIATLLYLLFMGLTLFLAFYPEEIPGRLILLVFAIFFQFLALIWYTLSYIPYAREMLTWCLGRYCCSSCVPALPFSQQVCSFILCVHSTPITFFFVHTRIRRKVGLCGECFVKDFRMCIIVVCGSCNILYFNPQLIFHYLQRFIKITRNQIPEIQGEYTRGKNKQTNRQIHILT